MNKKQSHGFRLIETKQKSINRIQCVLKKLNKQFSFRNISTIFGKLYAFKRKRIWKFSLIELIIRRKVQDAFLAMKSYQKQALNKKKTLISSKKLSISILVKFSLRKEKKQIFEVFEKLKSLKYNNLSSKLDILVFCMSNVVKNIEIKAFLQTSFNRLKAVSNNQRKINAFLVKLESFAIQIRRQNLAEYFSYILKQGYRKTYFDNLKKKQEKIQQEKNHHMNKIQQSRILKAEILLISKAFELEENSKHKNNKVDYDKNVVLQAKKVQMQRTDLQLRKSTFQYQYLKHQLTKKQQYLKKKQEQRSISENSQNTFKIVFDFLKAEKTKQNLSTKQMSIFLQRNNIDLTQTLKRFRQSKQITIDENINLKNLLNLYEKQMLGFGATVNIKESQTYKKTMEQNVNLREVLENLFANFLASQRKETLVTKEQLNRLTESHHNSQKGSKLTLTTLSSSTNGVLY